jgi:L-lysine 2,3-aminomutase
MSRSNIHTITETTTENEFVEVPKKTLYKMFSNYRDKADNLLNQTTDLMAELKYHKEAEELYKKKIQEQEHELIDKSNELKSMKKQKIPSAELENMNTNNMSKEDEFIKKIPQFVDEKFNKRYKSNMDDLKKSLFGNRCQY